jgi:prepilin-type N-terminal cleavage/methylation domain-containing protein
MRRGFTLIELLIVVAIIAILAAIAVPNFLEAQTRSKVARVKNDLRAIATGIESYRVDHNSYPDGTDSATGYDDRIANYLSQFGLQTGYYGFRTRNGSALTVGRDFYGITTPIAYMTSVPTDVFAGQASTIFTYCYRPAKTWKNGYVLSSVGPDTDLLAANGRGTQNPNVLGTAVDPKQIARLGDVNEEMVIRFIENNLVAPATAADLPKFRSLLEDLSYDPTNGTVSDGDLVRVGP